MSVFGPLCKPYYIHNNIYLTWCHE